MAWSVEFAPSAAREFRKLPRDLQLRLAMVVDGLAHNPLPRGAKKLKGGTAWRVRVGDYRIVYEIYERRLVVMVVRIAHRREVYR